MCATRRWWWVTAICVRVCGSTTKPTSVARVRHKSSILSRISCTVSEIRWRISLSLALTVDCDHQKRNRREHLMLLLWKSFQCRRQFQRLLVDWRDNLVSSIQSSVILKRSCLTCVVESVVGKISAKTCWRWLSSSSLSTRSTPESSKSPETTREEIRKPTTTATAYSHFKRTRHDQREWIHTWWTMIRSRSHASYAARSIAG